MTVYDRVKERERPDSTNLGGGLTDNGFFFEWRAVCDADDCKFREVAYDQAHAEWMERSHPCPMRYDPPRRYNYLSIAEHFWIELDGVVDEIKELGIDPGNPTTHKLQGRASGLAFAIMLACHNYYPDERAVSAEANKRWKIRKKQIDWEPTPGFKYDPPRIGDREVSIQNIPPDSKAPTYTRTKTDTEIRKLKAGQAEQIKHAMTGGMFAAADLAKVYSVSVETIEAIAKS
jgi:hypothetical protein